MKKTKTTDRKRLFAYVSPLVHTRVKVAAARNGIGMQDLVLRAVERYLDAQEQPSQETAE